MPDIHVPKLDGHGDSKSILKIVLEVALIGVGVFLGLMGEQWRETRRHHELAEEALRRFRTEITANRAMVAGVQDYHADRLKELRAYFDAPPAKRADVSLHLTKSANPPFLDRTAWELAIATQSLTYIDTDLAYALSAIYNAQGAIEGESQGFVQGMFTRPPSADQTAYFAALQAYFGDLMYFEPRLMTMYDDALARIDKVLKP